MPLYSDAYCILQAGCIVSAHPCEDPHGLESNFFGMSYLLMLGHTPKRVLVEYPDRQTRDRAFSNLRMLMGVHELDADQSTEL
jgi:hypothetical protein